MFVKARGKETKEIVDEETNTVKDEKNKRDKLSEKQLWGFSSIPGQMEIRLLSQWIRKNVFGKLCFNICSLA